MLLTDAPVAAILPVTDLTKAKSFYSDSLGLKESAMKVEGNLMFEAGKGTMLVLYQRAPVTIEHTQAGFMVEDLVAVMEELKGKGVKFEEYDMPGMKTENGIATIGGIKSAWFKDPDGNILAINEMP